MAIKVKGEAKAPVEYHSHFEVTRRKKSGEVVLRCVTEDGRKYNLATITAEGLKLRPGNNDPKLGIAVDRSGNVRVSA